MRKRIFIAWFMLVGLCASLSAQTYYKSTKEGEPVTRSSRWKNYARSQYVGIRLGLNSATGWFNHMGNISTDGRVGFKVGLVYGQQIASPDVPLFVEVGLGYSQKGFSSKLSDNLGQQYDYRHNMNMLEIPAVIKYKITVVGDLTVQPLLGAFFDIGLPSNTWINQHPDPELNRKRWDTFSDDVFSRFDAGIRFGAGLEWQNFYCEMTFDFGLTDILGSSDAVERLYTADHYEGFNESSRTFCFSLTVGVDF